MKEYTIFTINPGSSSTKCGIVKGNDKRCVRMNGVKGICRPDRSHSLNQKQVEIRQSERQGRIYEARRFAEY
ncbi:MAG: hypothetical protein V8R80_12715 [Eubacterium sp.]